MTEGNPLAGRPYGGRDQERKDELPGERPLPEDQQKQDAPDSSGRPGENEHASRAARDGEMAPGDPDLAEPTPGIPEPVDAPSPADATDADPPGGSAANQQGRVPDQ